MKILMLRQNKISIKTYKKLGWWIKIRSPFCLQENGVKGTCQGDRYIDMMVSMYPSP